jgi:hypothetical protein
MTAARGTPLVTVVQIELFDHPETWQERWYRRLFGRQAQRRVYCTLLAVYGHLIAIVVFAALNLQFEVPREVQVVEPLSANWSFAEEEPEAVELSFSQPEVPEGLPVAAAELPIPALEVNAPKIPSPLPGYVAPPALLPPDGSGLVRSPQVLLTATELKIGGGYEGRTAAARDRLAATRGGSPASERAVELGLSWLAEHQRNDGAWHFDHHTSRCDGKCSHPGTHNSTTGATALALLAFLGAGQTHRDGEHQQIVEKGLQYLLSRMVPSARGGDLQEGTMYAQGLATLALCEAYGLSRDQELRIPAQQAIDFIVNVQHPLGGWRYFPGQPGDTTVLGWQLMALQSGQLAGLEVPEQTLVRAHEFLDRVQGEQGSTYGYQSSGDQSTPSAVGLLCRMYRGWKRTDERLRIGVERIAATGPDLQDLYFTYYATQTIHHFDGALWEAWNKNLRDKLVALQATEGHAAGSWHTADYHTVSGGRLCDTALAIMILEVYYRHMPLYGYRSVEDFW